MHIPRSREADAFLATVAAAPPQAVSACAGWTTHEIAAHVTGIAVEVIRHLHPYLNGDPVPETRSFEEREAPLQDLDHAALLRHLDEQEQLMRTAVADVLDNEPDAEIPWTGRSMAVEKFIPHLRNEHALHRWDVAGDDETSNELLGAPDLIDHSVGELGEILLRAGRSHDPNPDADFAVRLRTPGQDDVHVLVRSGRAGLTRAPAEGPGDSGGADDHSAVVDIDPAARHLFIWGRRPDTRRRIHSQLPRQDLTRLQALLSGY